MRLGAILITFFAGSLLACQPNLVGFGPLTLSPKNASLTSAYPFETLPTNMTKVRTTHGSLLLSSGSILISGGDTTGKAVELYNPGERAPRQLAPMQFSRTHHFMFPMASGEVLILGGYPSQGEAYNVTTQTSRTLAPLNFGHADASQAVQLSSGAVVISGGAMG